MIVLSAKDYGKSGGFNQLLMSEKLAVEEAVC